MSLKNLLNTNLKSFYEDNPFAQQFQQGGIVDNPLVQIPGVVTETSFEGTVPGNITLRSITPSVSEDGFVGTVLNKLGVSKKVGKRYSTDNVWHDRNDGGTSQYPLVWTEMDPISKELKSPIQLTSLYQLVKPAERGAVDALRIGKWLSPLTTLKDATDVEGGSKWQNRYSKLKNNFNTSGLLFAASTLALSRQSPKIEGVERVFNPLTLILQAAGGAYGLRFQSTTFNPFFSLNKYFKSSQGGLRTGTTYENDYFFAQTDKEKNGRLLYPSSRLPSLFIEKILGYEIKDDKFSITNGEEDRATSLIQYGGGANAPFGIGATLIRRWANTTNERVLKQAAITWEGFSDGQGFTGGEVDTTITPSSNYTTPVPYGTNVLSHIQRYKVFNKENTPAGEGSGYGMSEGGFQTYRSLPKDESGRLDYLKSTKRRLDIINAQSEYKKDTDLDDANLIKFSIEVISNDIVNGETGGSEYLYFRAFIDQFSDSYKPKWDGYRYVGRAEEFYRYSSFSRDISLGFTIAAFARAEMTPLYHKINKLVGLTAPSYSNIGLMRGNIIRLTVGDYLVSVPGIITGLTLTPIFDAGWDINRDNNGSVKKYGDIGYTGQLPIAIKVDGFNFTPIHDFTPTKNSPFINGIGENTVEQLTDTKTAVGESLDNGDLTGNPRFDKKGNVINSPLSNEELANQAERKARRQKFVKKIFQKNTELDNPDFPFYF
jgi:hypothetical protein